MKWRLSRIFGGLLINMVGTRAVTAKRKMGGQFVGMHHIATEGMKSIGKSTHIRDRRVQQVLTVLKVKADHPLHLPKSVSSFTPSFNTSLFRSLWLTALVFCCTAVYLILSENQFSFFFEP